MEYVSTHGSPSFSTPGARAQQRRRSWCRATSPVFEPNFGLPRTFSDRYTKNDNIGKGGYGVIDRVTDNRTGKTYACKTISKRPKKIENDFGKLKRHEADIKFELDSLQSLQWSLSICRLLDKFEDDDNVYMIMDEYTGGLLEPKLEENELRRVMKMMMRAIWQCHTQDVLHLDIKPTNFMYATSEKNSHVVLIDFGLSLPDWKNQPSTAAIKGTPWYLSPEMTRSERTPAADVWAAGVSAYVLHKGAVPYNDREYALRPIMYKVFKSILEDEPEFERWTEFSDAGIDFIKSCLIKEVDQRITADEACHHPWLFETTADEHSTVIQKIQRFGRLSKAHRGCLEMLITELYDTCPRSIASYSPLTFEIFGKKEYIEPGELHNALKKYGFDILPVEGERLAENLNWYDENSIWNNTFVASQTDWTKLKRLYPNEFNRASIEVFRKLETNENLIEISGTNFDDFLERIDIPQAYIDLEQYEPKTDKVSAYT